MKDKCPDCKSELTPSIVGYLCHNCGAVHNFDKISSATQSVNPSGTDSESTISNSKTAHPQQNIMPSAHLAKPRLKHKLKAFVVPEINKLPKPVDESHLLEGSYPPMDDDAPQNPLGQPSEEGQLAELNPNDLIIAPAKKPAIVEQYTPHKSKTHSINKGSNKKPYKVKKSRGKLWLVVLSVAVVAVWSTALILYLK